MTNIKTKDKFAEKLSMMSMTFGVNYKSRNNIKFIMINPKNSLQLKCLLSENINHKSHKNSFKT